MRKHRIVLVLGLGLGVTGGMAAAQDYGSREDFESSLASPATVAPNLLNNSQFVGSYSSWLSSSGSSGVFAWVPNDSGGDPRSGAVRIDNVGSAAAGPSIRQCVPVTAGKKYVVGASAWIASGAPAGSKALFSAFFYTSADCTGALVASSTAATAVVERWSSAAVVAIAPPSSLSADVYLGAFKELATSTPMRAYFDKAYLHEGACAGTATSLCLNGERFKVTASWTRPDGTTGSGGTVPFNANSGSFWFFDPNNIEVNVKILDGCAVNGRYWVFASGGTNVRVVLTVTDTQAGTSRVYASPQGQLFTTIADTTAFATCS